MHCSTTSVVSCWIRSELTFIQCAQMRRFHTIWAIFGEPWAPLSCVLFTVGRFWGKKNCWRQLLGQAYFLSGTFSHNLGCFFIQNIWSPCFLFMLDMKRVDFYSRHSMLQQLIFDEGKILKLKIQLEVFFQPRFVKVNFEMESKKIFFRRIKKCLFGKPIFFKEEN